MVSGTPRPRGQGCLQGNCRDNLGQTHRQCLRAPSAEAVSCEVNQSQFLVSWRHRDRTQQELQRGRRRAISQPEREIVSASQAERMMKGTPQLAEETELTPDGNKRTRFLGSKTQPSHRMSGVRHIQEDSRHQTWRRDATREHSTRHPAAWKRTCWPAPRMTVTCWGRASSLLGRTSVHPFIRPSSHPSTGLSICPSSSQPPSTHAPSQRSLC